MPPLRCVRAYRCACVCMCLRTTVCFYVCMLCKLCKVQEKTRLRDGRAAARRIAPKLPRVTRRRCSALSGVGPNTCPQKGAQRHGALAPQLPPEAPKSRTMRQTPGKTFFFEKSADRCTGIFSLVFSGCCLDANAFYLLQSCPRPFAQKPGKTCLFERSADRRTIAQMR